jgi:DNA-binding CsgD family transcriptional regulator
MRDSVPDANQPKAKLPQFSHRGRAALVLPPHLSMEECIGVCMTVLGLTRAESVVALHLAVEQTPKKAANRIGCANGTFRSHTRAILLKVAAASSIGIAATVVAVLWSTGAMHATAANKKATQPD